VSGRSCRGLSSLARRLLIPRLNNVEPRIEFEGPAGHVKMALGDGHQGITETAYGTYRFNKQKQMPEIVDIIRYPAECVNPPAGVEAEKWIADGMKGAKCN